MKHGLDRKRAISASERRPLRRVGGAWLSHTIRELHFLVLYSDLSKEKSGELKWSEQRNGVAGATNVHCLLTLQSVLVAPGITCGRNKQSGDGACKEGSRCRRKRENAEPVRVCHSSSPRA